MKNVDWNYYNRFDEICGKYLPPMGEGPTMATQTVTAICKLVYGWYNDGDVYDNRHFLTGWANDLSSYANWLFKYGKAYKLQAIKTAKDNGDYEQILKAVADWFLDEDVLAEMDEMQAVGSVRDCDGPFRFDYPEGDEDDDDFLPF